MRGFVHRYPQPMISPAAASPARTDRWARAWHAAIAVIAVAALLMQVWIAVRVSGSPASHAVGRLRGTALGWRIGRVFSFFTIQSNCLSAALSLSLARKPARDGAGWRVARLDALLGITVTGVVYSTVIAKYDQLSGWQQHSVNACVHYIVPVAMVLGWLLFGPRPRIDGPTIGRALLWPAGYLTYILIQGRFSQWYPYPFLDVAGHGYLRVLVNAVAVLAVLAAVSGLYFLGDRRLRRAP